jgi:hypothetical protein
MRALGTGFNSIDGNPLAPPSMGCDTGFGNLDPGQSQSCCNATTRANTCGSGGQNPLSGAGNCVEIRGHNGIWNASAVKSVTPAMIEAQVPGAPVFPCLGGQAVEQVSVCKRSSPASGSTAICDVVDYCTNAIPF